MFFWSDSIRDAQFFCNAPDLLFADAILDLPASCVVMVWPRFHFPILLGVNKPPYPGIHSRRLSRHCVRYGVEDESLNDLLQFRPGASCPQ